MPPALAAESIRQRSAEGVEDARTGHRPRGRSRLRAIGPDRAPAQVAPKRDDLDSRQSHAQRDAPGPGRQATSRPEPRPLSPPGRVEPRRQQHVGAGLDMAAEQDEPRDQGQQPDRPRPGTCQGPIRRQEEPGHPDGHARDRIEQPDDQEAAEREGQAGEPAAPGPEPPGPCQQEHPHPRHPEPRGGHPGVRLGERAEIGDRVERVEDRALAVGQVRRAASRQAVPERQPPAPEHRPVELEPGLELKDRVHQQPVGRLERRSPLVAEARRHPEHVGRAEHLAGEQRLAQEPRHQRGQDGGEGPPFAAPRHGCIASLHRDRAQPLPRCRPSGITDSPAFLKPKPVRRGPRVASPPRIGSPRGRLNRRGRRSTSGIQSPGTRPRRGGRAPGRAARGSGSAGPRARPPARARRRTGRDRPAPSTSR